MSHIVIGKSGAHNVSINSKILMTTRLLITSDSGGGKTWLLKRLIEQAFGSVGIIVIDPEGEFAPLRTKFDFFLVGKGGDTPADIRTAEKVARTLLQGRASAVCDIYEMGASERHIWVQRFLDALLDAPKELRHPYFVIVDESHMFCPEHGKGESVASDAMRGLATRGRKRMLCGIYATQRLATLSKDLTGMCLNRLVGPTFESINQQRAALELGIPKGKDQTEFFASVKMLEPGHFYALGRAITKDLELVNVGSIETPHGQEALRYELKPPPPTEKVREWLTKLGDLPKQAEEEARTAADFKKQIRDLKAQLRNPQVQKLQSLATEPRAIERAVKSRDAVWKIEVNKLESAIKTLRATLGTIYRISGENNLRTSSVVATPPPTISGAEIQKGELLNRASAPLAGKAASQSHPRSREIAESNGTLKGPHRKILRALAELGSIGKTQPPKEMVAAWAGYSPNGGAFGNPLGNLRSLGYVDYPAGGLVQITNEGLAHVGELPPPDQEEITRRILAILKGPQRKILSVLIDIHGESIPKSELAERSGYAEGGGAFSNPLGNLRTAGFVEYPSPGNVRAVEWLFFE